MAAPKHIFSILIMSTFLKVDVEALVKDNVYKLGYGRTFYWVNDRGLDYLNYVDNVEAEDCCQSCKTNGSKGAAPDTEVFTFDMNEHNQRPPKKRCMCYKRESAGGQWPPTAKTGFWSGLCGQNSLDVYGAIGEGRLFYNGMAWNETRETLGFVDIENKDECCEKCAIVHPTTQMYNFEEGFAHCSCFESLPGVRPVTSAFITYAGMCGCNEKPHGISCCSAGFTPGDNRAKGEKFILADQYLSTCVETCTSLHPNSKGVTESVKQKYSSGNGRNKNKCWCELGQEPDLNFGNFDYQTCVFA